MSNISQSQLHTLQVIQFFCVPGATTGMENKNKKKSLQPGGLSIPQPRKQWNHELWSVRLRLPFLSVLPTGPSTPGRVDACISLQEYRHPEEWAHVHQGLHHWVASTLTKKDTREVMSQETGGDSFLKTWLHRADKKGGSCRPLIFLSQTALRKSPGHRSILSSWLLGGVMILTV